MDVTELSRDQLIELKGAYLDNQLYKKEGRDASYGELKNADEIVSDEEIFGVYSGYDFSPDDFSCSANNFTAVEGAVKTLASANYVRYRTEAFAGSGERDAAEVLAYEGFTLGNADIFDGIIKLLPEGSELIGKASGFIDELGDNSQNYRP